MTAIDLIKRAGNEALEINPPVGADLHITAHGSDWLFAALSLFGFVAICEYCWARLRRKNHERVFHYAFVFSQFILAIAYYTMGSDLGWAPVQAEFNHVTVENSSATPGLRQVFYARYIAWFLAFPPLIGCLAILNNVPWTEMIFVIVTYEVWIVALLAGSVVHSTYKWGYFVFGLVAYLVGAYNIVIPFRRCGQENTLIDRGVTRTYLVTSVCTVIITCLYFVCWGLSEGGNVIQPDSEAVFYGVLDVVLFVCVGLFFLWGVRDVDFRHIGIAYSDKAFLHGSSIIADIKEHPDITPPQESTVTATSAPADASQNV